MSDDFPIKSIILGFVAVVCLIIGGCSVNMVDKGTVEAGYRFGEFKYILQPGFHMTNPMNSFNTLDIKQRTVKLQNIEVPSQDQLISKADINIQYRADATKAETIFSDTGSLEQVIAVHLEPKARSVIREQGKSIERAEMFFQKETQQQLQEAIEASLREYMADKGIIIQAVLVRNMNLPDFISKAIERKKEKVTSILHLKMFS